MIRKHNAILIIQFNSLLKHKQPPDMKQSIEKIYQKKTPLQHVLLRPDSYIGSIQSHQQTMWVLNDQKNSFVYKKIQYCPGLYKIFDEILVNAADNYQRDHRMTKIQVYIQADGSIRVNNDGKSIPIQIHKEHHIYVAELIFGHLLTSSNYEDNIKKTTGGRNGYGAKLANIFSKKFQIRTGDSSTKKSLTIKWKNNMSQMEGPEITPYDGKDFTSVNFLPDYKRFNYKSGLTTDMISLLQKRVYDMAGILKLKVYLNNKQIKIKNFQNYVDYYISQNQNKVIDIGTRWKVILSCAETQFQQVSFVNSICTYKGGTHINYIMDQIIEKLMPAIKKKYKDIQIKPAQIKSFFFLFVNCLIENPSFDSQTKQNMTLKPANYGSQFQVSDKMIKEILKTNVVDKIINMIKTKQNQKISKQLKKKKDQRIIIPKLQDANLAGKGGKCTLILTEGDSAKSLAMSGIQQLGRDYYGVFPLRGKLVNVNQLTVKQVMENEELKHIVQIVGLQFNKNYTSTQNLRYSSIMIMADQDNDGSHIKGLILNLFHTFWPSLCKINGFLKQFITPIVRSRKGDQILDFFSLIDYQVWKQKNQSGWTSKYYKGLGTSTQKQAQQYFSRLDRHQITFQFKNQEDKQALQMAFNKKNTDLRKQWLSKFNPNLTIDYNRKVLLIKDFINQQLIHFSNADNIRSIPNLVDGLKPSQRKILFSCFKRNLRNQIKVAQLSGYVAEHSLYHHGEQSLCQTIVSLAQNFVGSNNLNLLQPIGQFGTRAMGGKDSASARYIYTALNPLTRFLFNEADDHIVQYIEEENVLIEPKYYYPILPLVLINGVEGIGTGWSTTINPFKVRDVIQMTRQKIEGRRFEQRLIGWEGYTGQIIPNNKGGFVVKGIYEVDQNTVTIKQLPIKKWTRDFKTYLQQKLETPQNKQAELQDIRQYHVGQKIEFVINYLENKLPQNLQKSLKLSINLMNSNMVLFSNNHQIKKYQQIEDILNQFYEVRLLAYEKRKKYLISKITRELEIIQMKTKFITEVTQGKFQLVGNKENWIKRLQNLKYKKYHELTKILSTKLQLTQNDEDNNDKKDYNYILNMPIWSFSAQKVKQFEQNQKKLTEQLNIISKLSIKQMWLHDIQEFENAWDQYNENKKQEKNKSNGKNKKINKISKIDINKLKFNNKAKTKKIKKNKQQYSDQCQEICQADIISVQDNQQSQQVIIKRKKVTKVNKNGQINTVEKQQIQKTKNKAKNQQKVQIVQIDQPINKRNLKRTKNLMKQKQKMKQILIDDSIEVQQDQYQLDKKILTSNKKQNKANIEPQSIQSLNINKPLQQEKIKQVINEQQNPLKNTKIQKNDKTKTKQKKFTNKNIIINSNKVQQINISHKQPQKPISMIQSLLDKYLKKPQISNNIENQKKASYQLSLAQRVFLKYNDEKLSTPLKNEGNINKKSQARSIQIQQIGIEEDKEEDEIQKFLQN